MCTSMCPPASAIAPSASPLNGTMIMLIPAALANPAAKICAEAPGIMPIRYFPGLAFASETKSFSVFHGELYCTATAAGSVLTIATKSKFDNEIGVGTVYFDVTADVEKKPTVYPSGMESATSRAPSTLLAPGLLTTATGLPSVLVSSCATIRPTTSVRPPAGKG